MKGILKYAVLTLAVFSSVSCYSEKKVYNRMVHTERDGKMLLGRQMKMQFTKEPFSEWYNKEYDEYEYDAQLVKELQKSKINSYEIIVFFGTWCTDTHRELPRLIKILEAAKYPENKIKLIAVNRKKETPDGEDVPYNIKRVPTIIVKKYGREVGRIIEMPETGFLEQDLLNIIKKK